MQIPKARLMSIDEMNRIRAREKAIATAQMTSDWALSQMAHDILNPRRCTDTPHERLAHIFACRQSSFHHSWMLAQAELDYEETPDEVGDIRDGYWQEQFRAERELMEQDYQAYKQSLAQTVSTPKARTIIPLGRYDAQDLREALLYWKKENKRLKEIELHFQADRVQVVDPAIELKTIGSFEVLSIEKATQGLTLQVCLETFTNGSSRIWGLLDNALHDVSLAIVDDRLRVQGDNWTAYLDAKQWRIVSN